MKAAIYYGVKDIRVEEVPTPECGPNDVLVKIIKCGICGSDTGSYMIGGHIGGNAPGKGIGHEVCGRVAEVGENVEGFQPGERVWIHPITSMPLGHSDMLGGFGEYVLVPNAKERFNLFHVPDELTDDEVALIEPFGVGVRGKNRAGAKPGSKVLVYGAGPIGLFCMAGLVTQGITPIAVVRSNKRREFLEKLGVIVCNTSEVNLHEFVKEHFGETKARIGYPIPDMDIMVDCAGAPQIPDEFVKMAHPGSKLSVVATTREPREIPSRLMSTEGEIIGSCSYSNEDLDEVIKILSERKTCITDVITHHFKLDDINEAMLTAAGRDGMKVIVDIE
ncbi:MAG: alcohol dehydrogenase catalytic domain-containing protein [Mogibacterium sp.]|nr:alcohol dehydrogenase catalytic domain-containing protein [Mogibacterium sp.]